MKLITLLIPAYNEEESLPLLYAHLLPMMAVLSDYQFELLFVNDGSQDQTLQVLTQLRTEDPRVCFVNLSRNFGKEIAMIAGLDYARGDAVIILDADLQDPPELIPQMVAFWQKGYDDVFAKRRSRQGESYLKKATSRWFYQLLKKLSSIPIQEDTGDFRLLDRRCVEALKMFRESQRYTKGMFSWIGYHKKEILFDRDARAAGETKWNYFKLINLAIEGITSFSIEPLRISMFAGAIISFFGFLLMMKIIIKTLIFGPDVNGYPSIMVVVLFLGGIQLLSLGILGEYIGRIFNETKRRPLYFVDKYNEKRIDNNEDAPKDMN